MRKLLLIASAAAMAVSMPALAKEKGNGGGKGGRGGKPAHAQKAEKHHGSGHGGGHGGWKAGKPHKADRGWARSEAKPEKRFQKHERKAEKNWAKADRNWQKQERKAERQWAKADAKREKNWRKAEQKAEKQWAKREERFRGSDRRFREERLARFDDRRYRDEDRRYASFDDNCPPGLAKKGNGCLPPGQAKKIFGLGERLPVAYYASYNVPDEYRDWYWDSPDYSYRYDDGYIYQVDNDTSLISALIPLLGGGFGVGNLLPAGYDVYNLPVQYRDDYYDTDEAYYRYGDDAIYQVDPQTQMIEAVVALLAGDLNVGQLLPSGYDTYNLPMEYRDDYVDDADSMYRYADGNIYEVDPQSRMIEALVAQLV